MTGYQSKRAAAQDKLAQPAQEPNWVCNECGAQEFTSALSEADLDYLACANCGGNEFHKEALAQPAQEPVAWMHVQGDYEEPSWRQLDDDEIEMGWKQYPLYTTPPQRKPLTDEEIWNLAANCLDSVLGRMQFARAIEAAHGIKE